MGVKNKPEVCYLKSSFEVYGVVLFFWIVTSAFYTVGAFDVEEPIVEESADLDKEEKEQFQYPSAKTIIKAGLILVGVGLLAYTYCNLYDFLNNPGHDPFWQVEGERLPVSKLKAIARRGVFGEVGEARTPEE